MANQEDVDSEETLGSKKLGGRENQDIELGEATMDQKTYDPNIVDWDGPDDPENPLNWSGLKKGLHIAYVSLFVLYANLAATMFAPGASALAKEFHITNSTVATFTVSIYVLGFMIGPLSLAPLSELYGRLPIYHVCNFFYIAFTLGCALSKNVGMFLAFRFLAGCSSAGPLTIGGGTIADMTTQDKRGKAMASFLLGPLLGPTIGPIIGGFVSQYIGWRWTFRIILILSGSLSLVSLLFLRETNATIILKRKTERLRKETGNTKLTSKLESNLSPRVLLTHSIVRPIKMILFSPITLLLSLYTGVLFGLVFLLFTTFPSIFEGQYGFSPGSSGLAYLGLGIGIICGLALFTLLSDKLLGHAAGDSKPAKPEKRLILMKWFAPITSLGVFLYGWSAYYKLHWIVPEIGTFVVGLGSLFVMLPAQAYLVDAFGAQAAASALAANVIIRSPFGAFLTFAAPPLYSNLGLGWGNTVLGFVCFAFTPVPWLFFRYGEFLRTRFAVEL
ncbi:MFS general substrate transporter [Annulohypoxylon maeteangense]|uniref:MFS general substrate transporter n=1 Tax=Annulohypoxylon maeteangense TaxID=1927788 RepID=UPI0020088D40|nr:MFS general substrate transporter [Annulohypoxylon maeteangense]KAI0884383.1 MFS general substrate transporter [Annulohypoxylon maeteangense]